MGVIHDIDLSIVKDTERMNVGWASRITGANLFGPDRSAMTALSERDYLLYNPKGNRLFGSATGEHYDSAGSPGSPGSPTLAGPAYASRPNDMNAQVQKVQVELTGNFFQMLQQLGVHANVSVQTNPQNSLRANKGLG